MKFKLLMGAITFACLLTSIGYVLHLDIPEPDYQLGDTIESTKSY